MKNSLLKLCLLILVSCRTIVPESYDELEDKLVLNSFLVAGDSIKVNLSLSDKIDPVPIHTISNATVKLYVDDTFSQELVHANNGYYLARGAVEKGKTYTYKVNVPGYDEVSCSQLVPESSAITSVEHINIAGKDQEGTSYPALKITFNNHPEIREYYEIELRYIINLRDGAVIENAAIHTIVDPVLLNEGLPIPLFSNELISEDSYSMLLNYTTNRSQSSNGGPLRTSLYPLVVELRKVSYDYYRYKKQVYLYKEGQMADGIFTSMINTNLYSNIDNGYGIFAAYSAVVSDTIVPNTEGYYYAY